VIKGGIDTPGKFQNLENWFSLRNKIMWWHGYGSPKSLVFIDVSVKALSFGTLLIDPGEQNNSHESEKHSPRQQVLAKVECANIAERARVRSILEARGRQCVG